MSHIDDLLMTAPSAEERIVEIAKAMREAYYEHRFMRYSPDTHLYEPGDIEVMFPWEEYRLAWLAAAAQAARMLGREDVIPSVGDGHWMAPVFGEGAKR